MRAADARRLDLHVGARAQVYFQFFVAREVTQVRFALEEPPALTEREHLHVPRRQRNSQMIRLRVQGSQRSRRRCRAARGGQLFAGIEFEAVHQGDGDGGAIHEPNLLRLQAGDGGRLLDAVELQIPELLLLRLLGRAGELEGGGRCRRRQRLLQTLPSESGRPHVELQLHRDVAGRAARPAIRDDGSADVEGLDLAALAVHPAGNHLGLGFAKSRAVAVRQGDPGAEIHRAAVRGERRGVIGRPVEAACEV